MRAFRLLLASLVLLAAASPAAAERDAGAADRGGALRYPVAKRTDLVEEHFGIKVADPYRWLENDVRTDPAVRDWVARENALTRRSLDPLPGRTILRKRIEALFSHGRFTLPRKAGKRYFYGYNSGLERQTPLYVREGLNGAQRLVIDPNSWAEDGGVALAEWAPSPDGRRLLYAVQEAGSDWRTLQILDVDSGKVLDDRIEWVKFSQLAWDGRSEGFFYARFAAPQEAYRSENLGQQIFYHRMCWSMRRRIGPSSAIWRR
jgi:prolyl oligopeptidase